jgi:hypothetical protein
MQPLFVEGARRARPGGGRAHAASPSEAVGALRLC